MHSETMANRQEWMRERIVQFAEAHTRKETLAHFTAEGVARSTIYDVLAKAEERGTSERKVGSGRPARIMTNQRKNGLRRSIDGRLGVSVRKLARKYNCTPQHVHQTIHKLGFTCRKRQRAPKYTEEQLLQVRKDKTRKFVQNFN